jgi:hypothetical protein
MMKKKLTLLIFLFPFCIMAQTGYNHGVFTIDFGKKKQQEDTVKKQNPQDQQQSQSDEDEDNPNPKPKKEKKQPVAKNTAVKEQTPDYRKDGLFKALFHIGINGAQIDGDNQSGYNQIGLDAGVGTLIRFHKFMSVSMCIDYSMKGARQKFVFDPNVPSLQKYQVQWDYMEVPVMLNFHAKNLLIFGLGLQPGVMVRYKEWDQDGDDVTNIAAQPNRFELEGIGALHFVIKEHFLLGIKFSYSITKARGNFMPSIRSGQYNNVLTFEFAYLMNPIKKKGRGIK